MVARLSSECIQIFVLAVSPEVLACLILALIFVVVSTISSFSRLGLTPSHVPNLVVIPFDQQQNMFSCGFLSSSFSYMEKTFVGLILCSSRFTPISIVLILLCYSLIITLCGIDDGIQYVRNTTLLVNTSLHTVLCVLQIFSFSDKPFAHILIWCDILFYCRYSEPFPFPLRLAEW